MLNSRLLTPQLTLNWLTRILFFTSLASLLPITTYIEAIGGNKSQIGIVMSAFALGVLVFRPLVGRTIDNVGRKLVLIGGAAIFVISPLIYIFTQSVPALLPVRVFHGLGLAAFGTASITLITDAAPPHDRVNVISYTGMVNTIAFAIGPTLGFFLLDKWGYNTLFTFASATSLLCLLASFFLRETRRASHAESRINYRQTISQRKIVIPSIVVLLVGLVHGGVMFYLPLFLKGIAMNKGLFFSVYGLTAFAIRTVVGPVSRKIGRGTVLIISILLLTAGVLVLSQTTTGFLMLLAAVVYGMGFGAHQPTLTSMVADNTTEETRGKVFSFYYGGFDLGISLAGLVLGAIAESYGIKNMFVVCGGLTFVAMLVFLLRLEKNVVRSIRTALAVNEPEYKHEPQGRVAKTPIEAG